MSRGRIIAAVAALLVIALIVGGVLLSANARVPQVSVATVEKQNLTQTVTASGQLEGDVEVDVFPNTQGAIKTIEVSDGEEVKAGQVLATLDQRPLDVAVAQADAGVEQAESQVVVAKRSAPTRSDFVAADSAVSAAKASVWAATTVYANANAAYVFVRDNPASTEASKTAAHISEQQAWAALVGARSQAAAAENQRTKLKNQEEAIEAAESGVNSAEAQLSLAQANRNEAQMVAPIDGVVVFSGGTSGAGAGAAAAALGGGAKPAVGAAVSPASAPFTVFQLGALNFNAQVDEADIANVKVGQKGTVTLDAFPGKDFVTKVVQVKTQAIQTSTGGTAFPVLLTLKDTGQRLLVGMGGNVDVEVSGIPDATVVPVEALFDEAGGTYVYVVTGNVVHRTKVKTGVMTDTQAQILEGVTPGQQVALGGLSNLKDGMTVRVTK